MSVDVNPPIVEYHCVLKEKFQKQWDDNFQVFLVEELESMDSFKVVGVDTLREKFREAVDSLYWYSDDQRLGRLERKVDSLFKLLSPRATSKKIKSIDSTILVIPLADWQYVKSIIAEKGFWFGRTFRRDGIIHYELLTPSDTLYPVPEYKRGE
ncbi:hypothetical protein C4561_01445 [candidate division WWE3 bacterium]|uniref:Uncharacterized protein n=1 Tax=candidate division WWE3 bacterium TaxID=2053526 RepID=A0A3A4ZLJ4_UNCKA|nr:MAG: hypothetical protein C4561_01445 [candidate division WWE3 bacterium]